jgi:uncharacterized protein (DUF58 family)
MIPKNLLRHVRRIEIRTTKLVNSLFGGEYHSVFKGQGIEFADVREYVPGDDIRTIDWNLTARFQHPFVKKYMEERELTVVFLVDCSASTQFGSREKLKSETIAETCALLAFSAWKNNDKVGLLSFTDRIEKYIAPRKGRSRILRVIREILYPAVSGTGTNIQLVLEFMNRVLRRRAIVFLISDFLSPQFSKPLRILARKHDLIAVKVTDPLEKNFPKAGFVSLKDAETGKTVVLNTGTKKWREEYRRLAEERAFKLDGEFKSARVDQIDIELGQNTVDPILRFFKEREKRFR